MKRFKILIVLSLTMMILLIGCSNKDSKPEVTEELLISSEEKALTVDIKSNSEILPNIGDIYYLELSPILQGKTPENTQYHWIIDNPLNTGERHPFEMFYLEDGKSALEVINNGEPVQFTTFAEVCYANSLPSYFDIILKIEDINTLEVIVEKKIIIKNRAGTYKIIRKEMTEKEKEEEFLNAVKEIVFNSLPENEKTNLDKDMSKANINTVVLKDDMGVILQDRYIGEEVYVIDFPGKDKSALPNNKIVFANKQVCEVVGYGYID